MIFNTGNEHTYCVMNLIYNTYISITVDMVDYLEEVIKEFGKNYYKKVKSPTAVYLFETDENQTKSDENTKALFHGIVAKLLFVGKQGCPDTQVTVAFLTTRGIKLDQDDWKKLQRIMCYIKSTLNI